MCELVSWERRLILGPENKVEHEIGLFFTYVNFVAILHRFYNNNTKPMPVFFLFRLHDGNE
jgi:hypothetical protein